MKLIEFIPQPLSHPICIAQRILWRNNWRQSPGDKTSVYWLYATNFSHSSGSDVEVRVMGTIHSTKVQSALRRSLTAMISWDSCSPKQQKHTQRWCESVTFFLPKLSTGHWARINFTEYSPLFPKQIKSLQNLFYYTCTNLKYRSYNISRYKQI